MFGHMSLVNVHIHNHLRHHIHHLLLILASSQNTCKYLVNTMVNCKNTNLFWYQFFIYKSLQWNLSNASIVSTFSPIFLLKKSKNIVINISYIYYIKYIIKIITWFLFMHFEITFFDNYMHAFTPKVALIIIIIIFLIWLSTEAVAFFHSPSSIFFPCLLLLSRLIYWETLSAWLSKLEDYGFDQLVS